MDSVVSTISTSKYAFFTQINVEKCVLPGYGVTVCFLFKYPAQLAIINPFPLPPHCTGV
jgi:hypothetical protein